MPVDFFKGKSNSLEKGQSLSEKYWKNQTSIFKNVNLDLNFTLYTNINSKWTIDLSVE